MLSRTADALYWMARYTERAENIARLLDVTYRTSLLPRSDATGYWATALSITGLESGYHAKHAAVRPADVVRFMAFDADNSSSIRSCLRLARENAHVVRGTLTSEAWETVNSTWLEVRNTQASQLGGELSTFFEWVKFRSHLMRGVTMGTMLRDEPFDFIHLGIFLERADNTARILDVKFDELAPRASPALDYYEWAALLRSVSAFEIYRRAYRDVLSPARVAELLVLRPDMPRSLHACMDAVHETLDRLANQQSGETQRLAGALHAALHYGRMEDVFARGLHRYLTDFLEQTARLGDRIAADFMLVAH